MLFSPFIHDLCFPSPFIILLLLYLYALSYLLPLFVVLSIFIALFIFLHTCEYYIVFIPSPVCFSMAKPEWLWRLI